METYYYFDRRLLEPRRKKKRFTKFALAIFLILSGVFIFTSFIFPKSDKSSSEEIPSINSSAKADTQVASSQTGSLNDAVSKALEGAQAEYGVYIKNLKTSEVFELNPHKSFDAASLYKLWIMGEVYNQIEQGLLSESQVLSQDVATLNRKFRIATDSAELTEGRITRTVADALFRMITYSDNYSALLLTEKIRLAKVAGLLQDNGLSESSIGTNGADPQTTAYDIALLLEKIYKGDFANSSKMIELLKQQTINGKIPKYLPDGIIIAHKTGELGAVSHDAAIIYTPNVDYIIVVMSNSNSKLGADERIANISRNVYGYFTNGE